MRRLYSTFSGGWPGTGLLLMRIVVAVALIMRAGLRLRNGPPMNVTVPAVLLMGAGILLLVGFRTRIAGTLVALTEIWKIFMLAGDRGSWLLMGTLGAALALLGPGLWSIDARRYGWKRIENTPRKKSSSPPSLE